MAVKRRKLRGKRLLIVAGTLAGATLIGCGDDGSPMDAPVANLLPPIDSAVDAPADSAADSATDAPPSDSSMDATTDGATDAASDTLMPIDAPVANLLPPPDSSADGA